MSLTAAASGFVVFLLSVQVIQGQNDWPVTYSSTEICALKGSTVDIRCTYRYPSRIYGRDTTVEKTSWFTKVNGNEFVDLRTDSEYSGRVQYHCDNNICTLRITDLRESDSAEYKFRFITNQPGGRYTGSPGVTLLVTDPGLQVLVSGTSWLSYWAKLKCQRGCHLPDHPSYVWYKNGQKIQTETSSSYSDYFYSADSYSCAVKGHEDSPSPSVCVFGQSCNRVTYTDRSICAFKGSSVDISSNYNSHKTIRSKFWFSPERSHQWQSPSQSEDLSEDFQYAGRVQVLETERGRSTLRITDLRESDSAQYHFKFTAGSFEWNSILPGTTLTVTDAPRVPSVSVSPSGEIVDNSTVTLTCSSDANPAANYTWYKENEDSPKASGQIFIITDFRPEHSGNYYCEAQNARGRHNSTLHLIAVAGNSTVMINIIRLTLVVVMPIPLLLFCLWMRKKKTLSSSTEPNEPTETMELQSVSDHINVSALNSVTAAQTEDTEEQEHLV
ncbi:B-cell receptor CD22-like isoform X6 [Dicentrarchus labrax]|uniref:B-cell receptor CD22-like isoform X6 n=1 Tax=Dicentrarchus labrax TaxID=13489 RepID=UPI0021F5AFE4|nr:B-cell receptor CD22-like isoform X6 [Dicentrarchus labrax]